MKKTLVIAGLSLGLLLLGWGLIVHVTFGDVGPGIAAVRYSEDHERCRIEVAYYEPFDMVVKDAGKEHRYQSRWDLLTFTQRVNVTTVLPYRAGGSTEWRSQVAGADYVVSAGGDDVILHIEAVAR